MASGTSKSSLLMKQWGDGTGRTNIKGFHFQMNFLEDEQIFYVGKTVVILQERLK
jgi:hypothetical protein